MGSINYNEITSQISNWIQSESNGQIQSIDEESVQMSMNIVKCLQPKNTEEVFLKLCALNLLNAAIKTDLFKDILSYELIKSTAAKLVIAIDCLKKGIISYYYHKDELCLYFEIGNIVFSFHHVPLTSEILKASFATPIKWPGIRLQRIAQPLFSQVVRLLEDDIELKAIIYKNDDEIVEDNIGTDADNFVDYNGLDTDMIPKETTMIEEFDNGSIIISDEEREQYAIDILSGVQLGDNVEINTYGILKNGRIGALNNQFIQLELAGNKHIRIKCDAISSIEFVSTANNKPFDLSFANNVLKEILIEEGLYPSSIIETNATITMVESRRIWVTTDGGDTIFCYKGVIIGYDKEKLVKGQRVFVPSPKKDKVYCVIMEMSYNNLCELFENLLSSPYKTRAQILSILTYIIKKIEHIEPLHKARDLKKQLKSLLSLFPSETSVEENIQNDDEIGKDSSKEIIPNKINTSVENLEKNSMVEGYNKEISTTEIPSTLIPGPKIIGKIDLAEFEKTKKKKEPEVSEIVMMNPNGSISINNDNGLIPSMGKIDRIGQEYGFIKPHNQENNLYFKTRELVSYVGIIDAPRLGDNVVYSLGQNYLGQPIAVCIHKQCTSDIVEDLAEKFRYDVKTYSRLKKHIDDFNNLNIETIDKTIGLAYYFEKVGINPSISFSPNDVEKLFAENLSSEEYIKGVNLLIDEVIKTDLSKSYNLFLRSFSYTKSHKMYNESEILVKKALSVFKRQEGKLKYFRGLLKSIHSLSNRIEITENLLSDIIYSLEERSIILPIYVKNAILNHKEFNGITPDPETIRKGLYKEEYIEEVKDYIKQNKADDLSYLTLIKLQLAFHSDEYDPMADIQNFLLNRAKNVLATGEEKLYNDVRYLLRLYYSNRTFESLDYTVGIYLMTLGDYSATEIEMYMNKPEGRIGYRFDDLLKKIVECDADNSLELAMLSSSNSNIRQRIIMEYENMRKNADIIDKFPSLLKEVRNRYITYSSNPVINFMSFISYLKTCTILLNSEMDIIENDFDKIVSLVTDFNIGQKYTSILNAYRNIDQRIVNITSKLSSNPTEIAYETLLPSLSLLKNNIYSKFVEIEQRVNPTITIAILESVRLEDSQLLELKVEIRNSGDSARDVHINSLKAYGGDLIEGNTVIVDVRLSADEEKTISIELHMSDRVFIENAAEVEFEIEYDDIFIATDQRECKTKIENRTIKFNKESFTEIENKFRHASGGEELEAGDSMFYGREALIVNIQNTILNGSKNQIAIYGQKRSGKSSLLNQIIGRLESNKNDSVICGKFNLQGLPDEESNPVNWILRTIANSLLRGIRKCGVKNIDKSILELFKTESDAFIALREFIEYINTIVELRNSHFVILIDEFTYLYQLIKDGKVSEDFMRRWIALIETPDVNLQTIVAAQDTLPHFMNESYASNYFNKFSKEPLSYLSKEEAIMLIKDPIKNVVFLNHAEELIYEYTSGSAFFTQIFCTRLVDYLNFKKSRTVGKEEIEAVADRLCTGTDRLEPSTFECLTKEADGSDFYENDNKKVLKAIAEQTRAGGHVNMEDIDVDMTQEHLREVLNNLYSRRVISKQGEDYSINVKLFVKWILNN